MDTRYLFYSLKVWIGSVLGASAIISLFWWIPNIQDASVFGVFQFFLLFVVIELVLSLFNWLMFWAFISLIVFYFDDEKLRRLLIYAAAIGLTVITFTAFSLLIVGMPFDPSVVALMLINCACIGIGAWLFYPRIVIDTPPPIPFESEPDER
ncbi:MAG: hypothetical protein ACHQHN_14610 [Sphingobacteriales bacterium]